MPTGLLLDANVLLLFYVGLLDRELVGTFKRTRQFTPGDFDLLKTIVDFHAGVVTTPHVLAEVSNLAQHLEGARRDDFFAMFAKSITLLKEVRSPASDLSGEPIFTRLGLSDAAVSQLARDDSLFVVTADVDLYVHLLTIGVRVINFNQATEVARFVEDLSNP